MHRDDSYLDLAGTGYCGSFNLRRTARAVTRLYDAALQEAGLRSTQFSILVGIAKHQPVPICALADVMVIDPTTLTRSLRLLQKAGLITISHRAAMRQRFLAVTAKGKGTLTRSLPVWKKAHERFVATVGSEHWLELRNELEKVAKMVSELENAPKPPRSLTGSRIA